MHTELEQEMPQKCHENSKNVIHQYFKNSKKGNILNHFFTNSETKNPQSMARAYLNKSEWLVTNMYYSRVKLNA